MLQLLSRGSAALRSAAFALVCALAVAISAVPEVALAQTASIETGGVTSFLTGEVIPGISAIGGVMLLVAVCFAGYRWVRGSAGGN